MSEKVVTRAHVRKSRAAPGPTPSSEDRRLRERANYLPSVKYLTTIPSPTGLPHPGENIRSASWVIGRTTRAQSVKFTSTGRSREQARMISYAARPWRRPGSSPTRNSRGLHRCLRSPPGTGGPTALFRSYSVRAEFQHVRTPRLRGHSRGASSDTPCPTIRAALRTDSDLIVACMVRSWRPSRTSGDELALQQFLNRHRCAVFPILHLNATNAIRRSSREIPEKNESCLGRMGSATLRRGEILSDAQCGSELGMRR